MWLLLSTMFKYQVPKLAQYAGNPVKASVPCNLPSKHTIFPFTTHSRISDIKLCINFFVFRCHAVFYCGVNCQKLVRGNRDLSTCDLLYCHIFGTHPELLRGDAHMMLVSYSFKSIKPPRALRNPSYLSLGLEISQDPVPRTQGQVRSLVRKSFFISEVKSTRWGANF